MRTESISQTEKIQITTNALLGQAVGDAFGVPAEFLDRKYVQQINLRDMVGCDDSPGFFSRWANLIPKGCWSDDTSMTVASMASFIHNQGKIDYPDQLRQFVKWWKDGEYCSFDFPFGLGGNISAALDRYQMGCPALECGGKQIMDNGNGALMRILPFTLYCIFHGLSCAETVEVVSNGSALTHGHEISKICCFIWTEFMRAAIETKSVHDAIGHIEELPYQEWFTKEAIDSVEVITGKQIRTLVEKEIGQTGYVVDTLYSALYSLDHAKNFEEAVLNAVNLGYDTDTAGAVTGMAAGILFTANDIPARWIENLRKRDYLENIARQFAACISRDRGR